MNRAEDINRQITALQNALSSNTSDVGDWKIIKIYEARMSGQDDPYNFDEVRAAREEIRAKINQLQAELATVETETTEESDEAAE